MGRLSSYMKELEIENSILKNRLQRQIDLDCYKMVNEIFGKESKEEEILKELKHNNYLECVFSFCLGFTLATFFIALHFYLK